MIRIFGSGTCNKCKALITAVSMLKIPHEYVDAMANETQQFCDQHAVDALPHIQILDEDGNVVWNKAGSVTLAEILAQIKAHNETE